jgi:hypothetical protein
LEPFEAATRKFAVDSLPTISIVLPVVTTLITGLENRKTDPPTIKKIKSTLRCSLEERFCKLYEDKTASVEDMNANNIYIYMNIVYFRHCWRQCWIHVGRILPFYKIHPIKIKPKPLRR